MPLYEIDPLISDDIKELAATYIDAAMEMAANLRKEIKNARYKRPKDKKGDWSFIDIAFWQATEGSFYNGIGDAIDALSKVKTCKILRKKGIGRLKIRPWPCSTSML